MALPVGVQTKTLSIGREFDGNGLTATLHIVVTPDFGGAQRILWTSTGETFAAKPFTPVTQTEPDGDPVETFDLPIVDEAGWVDMATGDAITDWQYAVTVSVTFVDTVNGVATKAKMKPYTKYVSPLSTDSSPIDMDRLPYGTPSTPSLAPGPYPSADAFGIDAARQSDLATAAANAVTAGKALLVTPGTYAVPNDLTITAPVLLYPGATIAPASGKTVTINAVVAGPPAQTVFGGAGTVILGKPQEVWADWWGAKGSAAAGTTTIQRALRGTAQGTKILLAGKYWASARIDVVANSTTGLGDQGKSLIGAAGPGTRTETAGSEWGAEVYLANGVNDDLFKATGTLTGAGQPPRFAFTVDNIKFNGNKANNASGLAAFRLHAVKDFYIGRILCENANGRGFYVSAASNQIIAQHVEAMNNGGTGIDLASAGDSHFTLLLAGANGAFGVQLGGGTQVGQIQTYSNTTAGVNFSGTLNAVSALRANANGAEGARFNGVTDNWVGVAYCYDNGTDTGTTATSRVGVRFDTGAARNKISHLNTTSTSGTQQYGVRYGSTLTGQDNLIDTYVGSGNAVGEVSNASARNRAAYVNGATTVDSLTVVGSFSAPGIGAPLRATKTTDETVNNSTTLQDDDQLTIALVANATYEIDAYVRVDGTTTADFKLGLSGPTGASAIWTAPGPSTGATSTGSGVWEDRTITQASSFGAGGAGAPVVVRVVGTFTTGSTAGNVTLRWAQVNPEVSDTKVLAGSWLRARLV